MSNNNLIRLKTIFIDDGGVISDNNLRALQWKDLVGKFFSTRYGGSMEAWASANEYALTQLIQRYTQKVKENPQINFKAYWKKEQVIWLINMFTMVNIDPPPNEQRAEIARLATEWITPRVQAAYPGVIETIRLLKNDGYTLYTASGEVSWELEGYLTGMGIVDCFKNFYGPDLINTAKASILFYERMFNDCGVNAREAMVIDDSIEMLSWAEEMESTIVHVTNFSKCTNTSCQHHINQLNELPVLISKLREKF